MHRESSPVPVQCKHRRAGADAPCGRDSKEEPDPKCYRGQLLLPTTQL